MDVSVVVAVKNGAATLRECIDSVLEQTGCDHELIVVDALSDDGTQSIVASYRSARIISIREEDHGIYDAWNKALTIARGRWCTYLGADDRFHRPDALADLVEAADSHPSRPVFVAGRHILIGDGDEREVGGRVGDLVSSLHRGELRSHVGALHRTTALREIGGFDTSFRTCGDLDALLRLSTAGMLWSTALVIAEVRWGGLSTRPTGAGALLSERWRILRRHHGYFAATWLAALPVIRRTSMRSVERLVRVLLGRGAASWTVQTLRRNPAP